MNSVLNGRLKRGHRGRTSFENAISRLDIQRMIEDALDERHAAHQAGECWCVDDDPVPMKRKSERRLQFKDR